MDGVQKGEKVTYDKKITTIIDQIEQLSIAECMQLLDALQVGPSAVVLTGVLISTHRVLASTPVSTTSACSS